MRKNEIDNLYRRAIGLIAIIKTFSFGIALAGLLFIFTILAEFAASEISIGTVLATLFFIAFMSIVTWGFSVVYLSLTHKFPKKVVFLATVRNAILVLLRIRNTQAADYQMESELFSKMKYL